MPVGMKAAPELMPTAEQREYIYHRIREVRAKEGGKEIFVMDFQNDGEFVGGCIAGGRNYCHINPKGDVEPCVFIHYSSANIREKSLLECLKQPLFMAYRDGQPFNDNMLRPCPMLENPELLQKMVHGRRLRINCGKSILIIRKDTQISRRNKRRDQLVKSRKIF